MVKISTFKTDKSKPQNVSKGAQPLWPFPMKLSVFSTFGWSRFLPLELSKSSSKLAYYKMQKLFFVKIAQHITLLIAN